MRRPSLLLLAIVFVPLAAGEGNFAQFSVAAETDPELRGSIDATFRTGIIELSPREIGIVPLTLTWRTARIDIVEVTRTSIGSAPFEIIASTETANRTIRLGEGSLRSISCAADCLLLGAIGEGGQGSIRGEARGVASRLTRPRTYEEAVPEEIKAAGFALRSPKGARADPGWLNLTPAEVHPLIENGTVGGTGSFEILLWDALVEVRAAGGDVRLVTGIMEEYRGGAPFTPSRTITTRVAVLSVDGGVLEAPLVAGMEVYASETTAMFEGILTVDAATGTIRSGARQHTFKSQDLAVEGNMSLIATPRGHAIHAGGIEETATGPETIEIKGEGNARVFLDGRAITSTPDEPTAAVRISLAALLAGIALRFLLPLYSRIRRGSLFANKTRLQLYELIKVHPGSSATMLAAEVGVARVVAQHHFRILEQHQAISFVCHGRSKRYFRSDHPETREARERRLLLEHALRRRIASFLNDAAVPPTQRDMAGVLGVRQSLLSYHLTKLERAGIVSRDARFPHRYTAARPKESEVPEGN